MSIIKRLLPYLKPYRPTIILTLFLGLCLSGVSLATAKLVQIIIDDIFVAKNQHMLFIAPAIIIALYVVSGCVRFVHMYLLRYTGDVIAFDIRNDLQAKYAWMGLEFHAENASGHLMSKTTNDVSLIQQGVTTLADCVREPVSAIAMLGYLFYTNWKLTCLVMFAAPLVVIVSKSLGRSVRKYSFIQQEIMEMFTNVLKETLDGIRIIKAFSLEKHMEGRFKGTTDKILEIRRKILSREELVGPLFELFAAMTFAGILFFAGSQAVRGETTVGAFMGFVVILGSLQRPIQKLQDAHVRLQHTIAASHRIFDVLDMPQTVREPSEMGRKAVSWPKDWDTITFKNVQFGYKGKPVLKGIDLTVRRGEVVALVGASGAGKTTLVNLLPRFYDVTDGGIEIGDVDVRHMTLADLRSHIGLVTQDVFLFNESIRENIVAGQKIVDLTRIHDAINAAHAGDFVERMPKGIDTIVGERGSQLSGGERQRISIARALFKNTPVLVLDEATSSLDSESEKIVQAALDELMTGRTTFVIAHRLSTIQKADRIIVLSDGKIIEQGNHSDLLAAQGAYHRLHANQFGQFA